MRENSVRIGAAAPFVVPFFDNEEFEGVQIGAVSPRK
jgi:hypothetical protein